MSARDGDAGKWGKLCYSLSGDGVPKNNFQGGIRPCSLPSTSQKHKPPPYWVDTSKGKGNSFSKINEKNNWQQAIDIFSEFDSKLNPAVMEPLPTTSQSFDEPSFSIDSKTGTISVLKVICFCCEFLLDFEISGES